MSDGVKNWEEGARRGRASQTARSEERAEAVREAFEFIAWKYRPKTRDEYARLLLEEGCPTPSGRGKWTGNLVNQYMRKFGQTSKSLLTQFPDGDEVREEYRPEVFAAYRAEIARIETPSEHTGRWISGLETVPRKGQLVSHAEFGYGDLIEETSPGKWACRFICQDDSGEAVFVDRIINAVDLTVFEYNLSVEQRRQKAIEFWQRLTAGETKEYRKLVDGWHL
jgi:hypothetical protein